jgi:hypothetical protein
MQFKKRIYSKLHKRYPVAKAVSIDELISIANDTNNNRYHVKNL